MVPCKNPLHPRQTFWTESILLEGVVHGMGIPAEICRWLTARHGRIASKSMFFYKLKRSPAMQAMMDECQRQLFDVAFVGIANRVMAGFPSDQRFIVSKLGPKYGLFTSHLKNGSDGSDELQPEVIADGELTDEQIAFLTDAELQTLIAADKAKEDVIARQKALSGTPDVAGR